MFLESLILHNFRCFSDLTVNFNNRLTVIVGGNGAGKSTVLDAATIAAGTLTSGKEITWTRNLNSAKGRGGLASAKPLILVAQSYQERMRSGDRELKLPIISYYGTGRLWAQHKERKKVILLKRITEVTDILTVWMVQPMIN